MTEYIDREMAVKAATINTSNLITGEITCEPGSGGFGFICSGSSFLYNSKPYVCIQSHYKFNDKWNPENCPSLWMPISSESSKFNKPKITNCKNCGAPLHGNVCEYCGTEY